MTVPRGVFVAVLLWFGFAISTAPQAHTPAPAPQAGDAAGYRAVLDRYCISCHNDRARLGGLALDTLDAAAIPDHADVWEKVVRKLQAGAMPPPGARRPDPATYAGMLRWLETELDRAAAAQPHPGPSSIRRLNRAEYGNAIRDLLALDVDAALLPPPDDSGFGFDNIADQLRVSPALLDRYLSAAGRISALAVGNAAMNPADTTYRTAPDLTQTPHIDGLPLGTRGGLLVRHTFPVDGRYVIKPKLWRSSSGFVRGLMYPHQLEITVDGERVHLVTVGGPRDFEPLGAQPLETEAAILGRIQVRVPVKAGPRTIGVTFIEKTAAAPLEILQPFDSPIDPFDSNGIPQIDSVTVSGPFDVTGPGDTPSRRRIFLCQPRRSSDEEPCARRILATLARRAYRRPVTEADVQVLYGFYRAGRQKGNFESGIEMALRRLLTDSEFVFRVERDEETAKPGTVQRVTDLELASRLSFFLWSSIPDDPLLQLASDGRLHDPAVLDQQVRRMLDDEKSSAIVANFAGQWLYLRNLQNVGPDRIAFPNFDDNLRQGFQRELELFFESVMREDRSVLDLLTADYTFLNERLARHYGIADVHGSHFRRVTLADEARKGLLGKGAILTVTSHADRTSPVVRGKWILDNLLGLPPPPAPPDVPPLTETAGEIGPRTMRAQMEEHRANPTCASCHKVMDPIGFALENFDGVGAWRTHDAGLPVDASGELADGTRVDGPVTLRRALRPELFVRTVTEKLLTYALGRGLTHRDAAVVRTIVRDAARRDYRFSSLVLAIVNSVPFQMRMSQRRNE
jgi:mono/diheme cytochrome c family protein